MFHTSSSYFKSGGTSTSPLLDGFIFRNGQAGNDLLNIDGSGNSTQLGTLLVNGISCISALSTSGNATCTSSLNVSGTTTLKYSLVDRFVTYNNTFPGLTAVNNATTHSMINIFPGINTQQGTLTADAYNINLSSFAYGTYLSGPQAYLTVNLTTLYNGCNTKVTLQAYGAAVSGRNYGSKIILNGGNSGNGLISFLNDGTTTCSISNNSLNLFLSAERTGAN
jgi:hypothetical protein